MLKYISYTYSCDSQIISQITVWIISHLCMQCNISQCDLLKAEYLKKRIIQVALVAANSGDGVWSAFQWWTNKVTWSAAEISWGSIHRAHCREWTGKTSSQYQRQLTTSTCTSSSCSQWSLCWRISLFKVLFFNYSI